MTDDEALNLKAGDLVEFWVQSRAVWTPATVAAVFDYRLLPHRGEVWIKAWVQRVTSAGKLYQIRDARPAGRARRPLKPGGLYLNVGTFKQPAWRGMDLPAEAPAGQVGKGGVMTREELEAVRRRAASATPGPWHVGRAASGLHADFCNGDCHNVWAESGEYGAVDVTAPCARLSPEDAEFIAHARADVEGLLAYIAGLEAHIAALEGLLADAALDLGKR